MLFPEWVHCSVVGCTLPSYLFSVQEMEKLCSRKLKITAKETMNIAEKLYTKGYIQMSRDVHTYMHAVGESL